MKERDISDLKKYKWWGEENSPPPNLKTKNQLSEIDLSPVKPVGVIECRKYDLLLYDIDDERSVKPKRKPTEKQKIASLKLSLRARWKKQIRHTKARNKAIEWAKNVILARGDYLIADTETTDLESPEIIEIGIIDLSGEVVFQSLIEPISAISEEAAKIHGITEESVKNAPSFREIYNELKDIFSGKRIIFYNASFDQRAFSRTAEVNHLDPLTITLDCCAEAYAKFCGDWSDRYRDYKMKPLNGGHRAIADCRRILELIREMADTRPEIENFEAWFAENYRDYLEE